jgi:hypothetical protein
LLLASTGKQAEAHARAVRDRLAPQLATKEDIDRL